MKVVQLSIAAALAAAAAGCGTGDETDSYSLVSVTGNVTLDGKPLEGAKVLFTPVEGSKPDTPGVDETGKEGNYKLMYRGRSGVSPGKYRVLVAKTLEGDAAAKVSQEHQDDPVLAAMDKQGALIAQGTKGAAKRAKPLIVNQMFDREVSAKGEVFDFDLKRP
jgi:hypothetical protein